MILYLTMLSAVAGVLLALPLGEYNEKVERSRPWWDKVKVQGHEVRLTRVVVKSDKSDSGLRNTENQFLFQYSTMRDSANKRHFPESSRIAGYNTYMPRLVDLNLLPRNGQLNTRRVTGRKLGPVSNVSPKQLTIWYKQLVDLHKRLKKINHKRHLAHKLLNAAKYARYGRESFASKILKVLAKDRESVRRLNNELMKEKQKNLELTLKNRFLIEQMHAAVPMKGQCIFKVVVYKLIGFLYWIGDGAKSLFNNMTMSTNNLDNSHTHRFIQSVMDIKKKHEDSEQKYHSVFPKIHNEKVKESRNRTMKWKRETPKRRIKRSYNLNYNNVNDKTREMSPQILLKNKSKTKMRFNKKYATYDTRGKQNKEKFESYVGGKIRKRLQKRHQPLDHANDMNSPEVLRDLNRIFGDSLPEQETSTKTNHINIPRTREDRLSTQHQDTQIDKNDKVQHSKTERDVLKNIETLTQRFLEADENLREDVDIGQRDEGGRANELPWNRAGEVNANDENSIGIGDVEDDKIYNLNNKRHGNHAFKKPRNVMESRDDDREYARTIQQKPFRVGGKGENGVYEIHYQDYRKNMEDSGNRRRLARFKRYIYPEGVDELDDDLYAPIYGPELDPQDIADLSVVHSRGRVFHPDPDHGFIDIDQELLDTGVKLHHPGGMDALLKVLVLEKDRIGRTLARIQNNTNLSEDLKNEIRKGKSQLAAVERRIKETRQDRQRDAKERRNKAIQEMKDTVERRTKNKLYVLQTKIKDLEEAINRKRELKKLNKAMQEKVAAHLKREELKREQEERAAYNKAVQRMKSERQSMLKEKMRQLQARANDFDAAVKANKPKGKGNKDLLSRFQDAKAMSDVGDYLDLDDPGYKIAHDLLHEKKLQESVVNRYLDSEDVID